MAFCRYCGKELTAGMSFCPACGKPSVTVSATGASQTSGVQSGQTPAAQPNWQTPNAQSVQPPAVQSGQTPAAQNWQTPNAQSWQTSSAQTPKTESPLGISTLPQEKGSSMSKEKKSGIVCIVGGVIVFIICSIIQGIGGSSMFATEYYVPDSALLDTLMNITFYPGWAITVGLIILGIRILFMNRNT